MRKTKRIYKMYPAWEFEREIQELEEQSEKGWHLVKGGLFHCKFTFDDTVRYRYALDFNQNIDDPARYRETFSEQGWEYINSTFNGWHYFRKRYDPSLPEEEYLIYTDTASFREMANRWKRIALILGIIELVLGMVLLGMNFLQPTVNSMASCLGSVLLGTVLILSTRWIGRAKPKKSTVWLLIASMILFITALVFGGFRSGGFSTQTEYVAPDDGSVWQIEFDVKLPDVYTLHVNIDAPEKVMICIVRENGGADASQCYYKEGTQIEDKTRLWLMPGTYTVYTRYLPGAKPGSAGSFDYKLD